MNVIFEFCYPALGEALAVGKDDRAATEAPATEPGRRTKVQLDMPTRLVNRMVTRRRSGDSDRSSRAGTD